MTGEERLQHFAQAVEQARRIVFFGGAGVSTESGVPDFRSEDGLYRQKFRYPPEVMLSSDFFWKHTEEFFAFYREKLLPVDIQPNVTHRKLAQLERRGKLRAVVTQNIDGLHQLAGSQNVYELHGSTLRNHCVRCGRAWPVETVREANGVPRCSCGGVVKPDVVLYGESLDEQVLQGAVREISTCDLLIVGGTSLAVYPAAGLLRYFQGDRLILINRDETPYDARADLVIHDSLGRVFSSCIPDEEGAPGVDAAIPDGEHKKT